MLKPGKIISGDTFLGPWAVGIIPCIESKDVAVYGDVIGKPFGESFRGAQPVKQDACGCIEGIFYFKSGSHFLKDDFDAI